MDDNIPSFKDFKNQRNIIEGDKIKIEEIPNKPIIVTNYEVTDSKHYKSGGSRCLKIQFYREDDETKTRKILFTGSSVLIKQIEDAKKELEDKGLSFVFRATITKISNYYSFT